MLKYWVWLSELPGLGNQARLALLRHFASPEEIYYADAEELELAEGLTKEQVQRVLQNKDLSGASRILGECQRLSQRILTIQDAGYPRRLQNIFDPPCLLYVKGRLPEVDEEVLVAVVGTRSCTPYGIRCAEKLGFGLAAGGGIVVTGLAKGVDAAAARGALRAGGTVIGVTGNGLDVYYPYESRSLYDDVAASGALLSEYPPGTEPEGRHFPVRNRIMSGLSLAALVVEAPVRSGAMITARLALDQGRDLFAVPGPIDAPASVGCIRLMQEGAGPVIDAWDLLREYEHRFPDKLRPAGPMPEMRVQTARRDMDAKPPEVTETLPELPVHSAEGLTDDQISLLAVLEPVNPIQVDDLIQASGIPARRVLSALTILEIDGLVQQHSGKFYTRTVNLAENQE